MQKLDKNKSKKSTEFLAILILLTILCVCFRKVLFEHVSISRLALLPEWDSVFDAWRTGHSQAYDPSLVQIFLPNNLFSAEKLALGIFPLWNPYSGLGYPFIADIQNMVFAPLKYCFNLGGGLYSYNLFLLTELALGLISCFYLGRFLGLNYIAAIFSSLIYVFCPYNLFYLELNTGSSSEFFPLVTLAFLNLARKQNLAAVVLAAFASALLILSGHPECSFFCIVFSSVLLFFVLVFSVKFSKDKFAIRPFFLKAFFLFCLLACFTIAYTAPMLFPFAEYLLNADTYKYGTSFSTPVSWNGILFNLCHPGVEGASPYLGIMTPVLFIIAIIYGIIKDEKNKIEIFALVATTIFAFLLISQLGPIALLFSKAPLTAIITRYGLPYLLLLISVLSGYGLSYVLNWDSLVQSSKILFYTMRIAVLLLLFPLLVSNNLIFLKAANFDAMLPDTTFNFSFWLNSCFLSLAFCLLICLKPLIIKHFLINYSLNIQKIKYSIDIFVIGFVLISLFLISKLSLPQENNFFYPKLEILDRLKNSQFRIISTVDYVLRPATNIVYDINQFQVHSPMFPRRYLDFVKMSGAQVDIFNQNFSGKLGKLLDLAAVKYVLSFENSENMVTEPNRFKKIFKSNNNICIFENKNALARALMVQNAINVRSSEEAKNLLLSSTFDPKRFVIIEDTLSSIDTQKSFSKFDQNNGNIDSIIYSFKDDLNKITIECFSQSVNYLVLSDIYYPGWKAYVDGKESKILRANFAFRALKLNQGKHSIVFSYEPIYFRYGLIIFFVSMLVAFVIFLSSILKKIIKQPEQNRENRERCDNA